MGKQSTGIVDEAQIFATLHKVLLPLTSEQRKRIVASVFTMLGDDQPSTTGGGGEGPGVGHKGATTTLAKYIRDHGAGGKPTLRFLAVANWLHEKGNDRVTLAQVTKAVSEAKQKKFSNASTFLKGNTSSGCVEGDASGFYVTDEGRSALGIKS